MSDLFPLKKGGILERAIKSNSDGDGKCASCGNLIKVSETALGCVAHDKLIMPEYPPYPAIGGNKCKSWKKGDDKNVKDCDRSEAR